MKKVLDKRFFMCYTLHRTLNFITVGDVGMKTWNKNKFYNSGEHLMRKIIFTLILTLFPFLVVLGQETKNKFEIEASYNRTDIPAYNEKAEVENVNGFTIGGNVKLFSFKRGDVRAAYNFRRKLNQEVYPWYNNGMEFVDLYRDVDTHSVGAEASYSIFFAGLFYGSRKIHEDTPYQLVRYVRFGVKVPTKGGVFFKGYLDYEQPYGTLPTGFINPYNRTLGFGLGYGFGGKN